MSSYAFSHQFCQRWTGAPEPIRAAITQELKDIITLLQADTPFAPFVFSTHDLDAHLDELYDNHEAEQAIAKAIIDQQEQTRLEEAQTAKEAKKDGHLEAGLKEAAKRHQEVPSAQKEQPRNEQTVTDEDHSDAKGATDTAASASFKRGDEKKPDADASANSNPVDDSALLSDNAIQTNQRIKAVNDTTTAATKLTLKDTSLSTTHSELIGNLERQIDDYLSEQMLLMSENLKSWLHAELSQHLNDSDKKTP